MLNKNLLREIGREKNSLLILILLKVFDLFTNIALIFSIGNFLNEIVKGNYLVKGFLFQIFSIILIKIMNLMKIIIK